jgi:diguanylate cyclase (GGDEF)-like protein
VLVRANERCYRLSGDEFVVLCRTRTPAEAAAAAIAVERRIKTALADPIATDSVSVTIGAAVGAAVCPRDATTTEQLLAHADQAMYADKRAGKLAARAHVGYDT